MNQLKILLRQVAEAIVAHDAIWTPVSRSLVRGSQFLCSVRDLHEVEQVVEKSPRLKEVFSAQKIISGPFEGMNYGDTRAFCSALHPKLLGTYEFELADAVNAAIAKRYPVVVDVGAADGYYAVGFALKDQQTRVIAFEQDERARTELTKLIETNQVGGRVEIRGKCEPSDLLALDPARGLMIMDCEGYEEHLLTAGVIAHFKAWDFIIETHDGFDPEITASLTSRFSITHDVMPIEVIHDRNKADHIKLPLLDGLPRRDVDKLLAENRQHACLRWIVCHSKAAAG